MYNPLLIVFIKNTEKGKVKTRLAKTIGDEKALSVYQQLLSHTHQITSPLAVAKQVYYSNFVAENDMWNDGNFTKHIQQGNDLGERMSTAFEQGFKSGHQPICIIGSDCYALNTQIIETAFEQLKSSDVVLGPATDGGYYLLGMNHFYPDLFTNKTYSTAHVYKEAREEVEKLHKTLYTLPELSDIDTIDDLVRSGLN